MDGSFDDWVDQGCPPDEPSGMFPGARVYSRIHKLDGVIVYVDPNGQKHFAADGWSREDATPHNSKDLAPPRSKGVIYPGKASRADALSGDMLALHAVKPKLTGRYLVKNWLERGAASVVYGESNVGKTFFAMDLAFHVAACLPWHGIKVAGMADQPWPGMVYYLALEGGSGFVNRICAMRQERPDIFERIEGEGGFVPWPTSIDLHGATDGEAIASAIEERNSATALVVIDTLARAMGEGDENTAKDMGQFVRNVDLIRDRTSAHVMVIHHSGKDTSKGARGSGSLRGAVDTEIELTRSGSVVMAEARKQRDMPTDKVFAYSLRSVFIGHDEDGDPVTSAVVVPAEPVKKTPRLSGQQKIAMQAFEDAIAHHGEKKHGEMFPDNRQCVALDHWREYCDRHSLSSGEGDSSKRTAFHKVKNALQDKEVIRVVDGYAWRCEQ
ncbi:AAA family ATPase [Mameliella sp.]|uniref:AAA family ATPase n=1 Tax=Mameliella sp. TaxID=1924940 RepID=UPI003BAC70DA